MKKIDIIIQGLFFIAALLSVAILFVEDDSLILILGIQFWLGAYQLLSALIRVIFWKHVKLRAKRLLIYYWIATITSLTAIGFMIPILQFETIVWVPIVVIIPWCIALFYIYISWIDTYSKPEVRSKFLPNIHI